MLAHLFPQLNEPLEPIPTGLSPRLSALEDIQAIVFDIYGTLVLSGTGDISIAQTIDRESELQHILNNQGYRIDKNTQLLEQFYSLIQEDHANSKASGAVYPEVDIVEIWSRFLAKHFSDLVEPTRLKEIAIRFECAVNPVWPMPDLETVLFKINALNKTLGIVRTPNSIHHSCSKGLPIRKYTSSVSRRISLFGPIRKDSENHR